ncbi:MAG: SIMPL domain-containing protein [Lachnospiraceae bacterium]|nr:SIMPL domain-containing protein [Lachnospiraceae bacterium]
MERTIRVTGKGKISVKPDMIRLLLNLEEVFEEYEQTLQQSAKQVELLKDCFETLGFERTALKTLSFNIDTENESYKDKQGIWRSKFVGYKFRHAMKIEFEADNKLLGKVLYALAHCAVRPEFRIQYTVRDVEAAKNQLLGKAVADSKEKAKVLSEAAGVELKDIILIDYSWGEIELVSQPMDRCMTLQESCCDMGAGAYEIDIEADDIDMSDTVTVVWGIE